MSSPFLDHILCRSDLLMLDASVALDAHSSHCRCCLVSVRKLTVMLSLDFLCWRTLERVFIPDLCLSALFFFPTLWCTAKYTKLQAACTFFLCNWKLLFSWVMLSVFGKEVTKLSSCLSTPLTLSTCCAGRICWCWTLVALDAYS